MEKKSLITRVVIGVVIFLVFINLLLPKDFSGYYRDIDMLREEETEIYENGMFVHTQKTKNRYTDFIIGEDIHIIKIKEKNTVWGSKYRVILRQTTFDFYEVLEQSIKNYETHQEGYFFSVGRFDQVFNKPYEDVLWSILPAEYVVENLEADVSMHKFTFEDNEYVLYVKVEKVEWVWLFYPNTYVLAQLFDSVKNGE